MEFKFNKTNKEGWQWVPIRVRNDKTAEFKKGNKNFGFEVNWPVSEFLLNNNFYDSYREVNPNISESLGLTWSPGYPKNSFDSWDIHDRIDMIYYKNGINKKVNILLKRRDSIIRIKVQPTDIRNLQPKQKS